MSADDRLPIRHPVPRMTTALGFPAAGVRGLQASVSPTPLPQTPAPPREWIAILQAADWLSRHRQWASSLRRASEHTAPKRGYFFFLATAFFFAGAFFFAAVFAFVAFFTMMPSSSELAVLHQHVRES